MENHTGEVAPDATKRVLEAASGKALLWVAKAQNLYELVQVLRPTHLRLHHPEVAGNVRQQARLAARCNAIPVLLFWLPVGWWREVEEDRERTLKRPVDALCCGPGPPNGELVEKRALPVLWRL